MRGTGCETVFELAVAGAVADPLALVLAFSSEGTSTLADRSKRARFAGRFEGVEGAEEVACSLLSGTASDARFVVEESIAAEGARRDTGFEAAELSIE